MDKIVTWVDTFAEVKYLLCYLSIRCLVSADARNYLDSRDIQSQPDLLEVLQSYSESSGHLCAGALICTCGALSQQGQKCFNSGRKQTWVKCFHCLEPGHKASHCPKSQKELPSYHQGEKTDGDNRNVMCYGCGRQ